MTATLAILRRGAEALWSIFMGQTIVTFAHSVIVWRFIAMGEMANWERAAGLMAGIAYDYAMFVRPRRAASPSPSNRK